MQSPNQNKINVQQWIEDNKKDFLPPVCNKLMHNEQLTIMFVGGPNIRKDFHFEEGEELFYQLKGEMCLKIVKKNQHHDVIIKQGEMFLLPGRVPHSPNRFENTVGFVMERRRDETELDCLRYYQEDSTNRLFERWFHTIDLGIQLVPVIKEFFASEEYRTGQPKSDSFPETPLIFDDQKATIDPPFSLAERLEKHKDDFAAGRTVSLFRDECQTRVLAIPHGKHSIDCSTGDVWLWQQNGRSTLNTGNQSEEIVLDQEDSIYLRQNSK